MKVRATAKGWDGARLRQEGDVFDYSGKLGSWMEEVEVPKKEAKPKKSKKAVSKD